jgi:hypothetical protein
MRHHPSCPARTTDGKCVCPPPTETVGDVLDRLTAERYGQSLWWTPRTAPDTIVNQARRRVAMVSDFERAATTPRPVK